MNEEHSQDQVASPLNCFSVVRAITSDRNPIFHAIDNKSNRHVVLKTFPHKSVDDKSYLREKNHLLSLNHPNIIQLYEYVDNTVSNLESIEKNISYLALEYASHGDMLDVISKHGCLPELLARTLFHQLIDVLSYLHRRNVAHMDLKVDNILIDDSFNLKLIDFDLSQSLDSSFLEARGTAGYRAPEIKNGVCGNLKTADVYSAAVVMFIMVTGHPPYTEHPKGCDTEYDAFYRLLRKNHGRFWEVHSKHKNNPDFYSATFKDLITSMLAEEHRERPTLEEIKSSQWYNGPVLSQEDYKNEMKKYLHIE